MNVHPGGVLIAAKKDIPFEPFKLEEFGPDICGITTRAGSQTHRVVNVCLRPKSAPVDLTKVADAIPRRTADSLTLICGDGNLSSSLLAEPDLQPSYEAALERGRAF